MLNWIVFTIYCLAMLLIGWYGYRATKDTADYYVAGRRLGLGVAVPLFAAGFFSAASVVGQSAFAYQNGWSYFAIYPTGLALGWWLLALIAPRFSDIKRPWFTTPDMFADRYYSPRIMRGWMSIFVLINMSLFVIQGLTGAGAILSAYLGISYGLAIILMGIVFVAYTSLGGMFSVAWTNVAQFALLAFAVIFTAIFGIYKGGGVANINVLLHELDPALVTATAGGQYSITYIIGTILSLAMGCPILSYYHRMFFSTRSTKVATGMIGFGAIALTICYLGILFIGLSARTILPAGVADAEGVFSAMIRLMNPVVGIVAICGVIAALQSSVDNQLLAGSSAFANDIYKKLMHPNATVAQVMNASRWGTLALGAICTFVAYLRPGTIVQIYNLNNNLGSCVIFTPLMLGLFWPRCTKEAGIIGSIFGFIAAVLWILFGSKNIPAVLVVVPLNFIIMIIVSYLTPEPPQEVIKGFFPKKFEAEKSSVNL